MSHPEICTALMLLGFAPSGWKVDGEKWEMGKGKIRVYHPYPNTYTVDMDWGDSRSHFFDETSDTLIDKLRVVLDDS